MLNQWFNTPLGHVMVKEFSMALEPFAGYLKGDRLLQLGDCGANPWLEWVSFNSSWIASPFILPIPYQIQCLFNQIPLARDSVDCVIAPLVLEPFGGSYSVLDEIDRILKPMGFVILCCINPWSMWGWAAKSGYLKCYGDNKVSMHSSFSLNRVLIQRGYRQCALVHFCYAPPVNSQSVIKRFGFLNEVGKMLWPFPSGLYCYIAQKYEVIEPTLCRYQPVRMQESSLQASLGTVIHLS